MSTIITTPLGERTIWAEKRLKNLADPTAEGELVDWVAAGYAASDDLDGGVAGGEEIYVTIEYESDAGTYAIATLFIGGVATVMNQVPLRLHPSAAQDNDFRYAAILSINFPNIAGVVYRATVTFEKPDYEDREPCVKFYQVQ